jgi:hypothetical protein
LGIEDVDIVGVVVVEGPEVLVPLEVKDPDILSGSLVGHGVPEPGGEGSFALGVFQIEIVLDPEAAGAGLERGQALGGAQGEDRQGRRGGEAYEKFASLHGIVLTFYRSFSLLDVLWIKCAKEEAFYVGPNPRAENCFGEILSYFDAGDKVL